MKQSRVRKEGSEVKKCCCYALRETESGSASGAFFASGPQSLFAGPLLSSKA